MMEIRLINQKDYPDASKQEIDDINISVNRYIQLSPYHNSLLKKYEIEDSHRDKIAKFVGILITVIVFIVICFPPFSTVNFLNIILWPPLIGFVFYLFFRNFIKAPYPNKTSSELSILKATIDRFKNDMDIRRKNIEAQQLRNEITFWIKMSGHEFEKNIANLYNSLGYIVQRTRGSGDGGIDLYLEKDSIRYVVQCKNHKSPVGPAPIRDLYGAMHHEKISRGIFIASNGYTVGAKEFAKGKIELLDIKDIVYMHKSTNLKRSI